MLISPPGAVLEGSASPSEQIRGRWHPHPQRRGDSPSRRPQFNPPRWASSSWSGLQVLCDAKALACQSKRLGRGRSLPSGGAGAPDQQERAQHQELNRKRRDGEPPRRPPRQTRRNATGEARRHTSRDTKKQRGAEETRRLLRAGTHKKRDEYAAGRAMRGEHLFVLSAYWI